MLNKGLQLLKLLRSKGSHFLSHRGLLLFGIAGALILFTVALLFVRLNDIDLLFWRDKGPVKVSLDAVTPVDLRVVEVNKTYFVIKWYTEVDNVGFVKYGKSSNDVHTEVMQEEGIYPVKDHTVKVRDLEPARRYYFYVVSSGQVFGKNNKPLEIMTTL